MEREYITYLLTSGSRIHILNQLLTVLFNSLSYHCDFSIVLGVSSQSRIFSLIWRRHHCRWRSGNIYLCSALMGKSNEESLMCHTFCDMREDCKIVITIIHSIRINLCTTYKYILLSFLLDNSRVKLTYVYCLKKSIVFVCLYMYILNFYCINILLFFIYFLFTHRNKTHSVLKWIY